MTETPSPTSTQAVNVDNGRGAAVGTFRITFQFLTRPFGTPMDPAKEDYVTPIGLIGDLYEEGTDAEGGKTRSLLEKQPKVSLRQPYEGTLTDHELRWLTALPGTTYNPGYRFAIEPLDDAARQALAALT